jgi:hypothetical protein
MSDFDRDKWVRNALRRASFKYPPRYTAKINARVAKGRYRCALCGREDVRDKDTELDHIHPAVNPETGNRNSDGSINWNEEIPRMLPYLEGWQLVCKTCHLTKSIGENEVRRKNRKKN